MNDYLKIQGTIDYIEQNLKTRLSLSEVANVSGYSVPHFYRIFQAIVQMPVMEYIRKRKLSTAKSEIMNTNKRIIDIALEFGFESHETFLRAFTAMYQQSPSKCRKSGIQLHEFKRIEVQKLDDHYVPKILPEIVTRSTEVIYGESKKFTQREQIQFNLIKAFRSEMERIFDVYEYNLRESTYVIAYDYDSGEILRNQDLVYEYFVGIPYEKAIKLSLNLRTKEIPEATYAKFTYHCTHKTLNGIPFGGSIYDYIDGIWLPNSIYQLSDAPDIEVVKAAEGILEYYISIKEEIQ